MSLPPSPDMQEQTALARPPHRAWPNQLAVARGATSVALDTAAPATHLIDLYRAWGFLPADTIHWSGKTYDSVIMIRTLSGADG